MEYRSLICHPAAGAHTAELLTALLAEDGFESFVENEDGALQAYIPSSLWSEEIEKRLKSQDYKDLLASYSWQTIADQNWNAVWESQYEPVLIDGQCSVRAPFHTKPEGVKYDIVIMPKMSFGTAHHETTKLMIRYLLEINVQGKSLLDMGSGTAVLAVLAAMRGAARLTAIDNDEWAYNNALENVQTNQFGNIEVLLGDAALLTGRHFDIVLANINRNILLNDMAAYHKRLPANGILLMSGFYESDLPLIKEKAISLGLKYVSHKAENQWVAAYFSC